MRPGGNPSQRRLIDLRTNPPRQKNGNQHLPTASSGKWKPPPSPGKSQHEPTQNNTPPLRSNPAQPVESANLTTTTLQNANGRFSTRPSIFKQSHLANVVQNVLVYLTRTYHHTLTCHIILFLSHTCQINPPILMTITVWTKLQNWKIRLRVIEARKKVVRNNNKKPNRNQY